jgi:hypothetical protein
MWYHNRPVLRLQHRFFSLLIFDRWKACLLLIWNTRYPSWSKPRWPLLQLHTSG